MTAGQFMIPVVEVDHETGRVVTTDFYTESKVHFFIDDLEDYRPLMACGKRPHHHAEPWEMPLRDVTCKSCKRTNAYREALTAAEPLEEELARADFGEFPDGF